MVAEKFEALVSLGIANTRMKDFYDLWQIAQAFSFTHSKLANAVHRTFGRRKTPLPTQTPTGLTQIFAAEKAGLWRAFLGRERLMAAPPELSTVITDLSVFLMPLLE